MHKTKEINNMNEQVNEHMESIQKGLSKIISEEASAEVANLGNEKLISMVGLIDEQLAIQGFQPEEVTVHSLLESIYQTASEIADLEEGKLYPYNIIGLDGNRIATETALNRAKILADNIIINDLVQLSDLLGVGVKKDDSK